MNIETLNNQIKELEKLKIEIRKENEELEHDLVHKEMNNGQEELSEEKQLLMAESQELKIKMLNLKEKLKALDQYLIETAKDIEKKNKKLQQLQGSQTELKDLFDKKRVENEQKQLNEVDHLKSQKMKRDNLMVKLRMVKNEEFKNLAVLEDNKSLYEERHKQFIALKLLTSDKNKGKRDFAVNTNEEINRLVWQKTKLEEYILKKELYIKHRNELLDVSSFNSEKDFHIN